MWPLIFFVKILRNREPTTAVQFLFERIFLLDAFRSASFLPQLFVDPRTIRGSLQGWDSLEVTVQMFLRLGQFRGSYSWDSSEVLKVGTVGFRFLCHEDCRSGIGSRIWNLEDTGASASPHGSASSRRS